jgi:protein-L-isoaspartate(D-aspartate) O-methyltransferase
MRAVDRGLFVTPDCTAVASEDRPLPIGDDATISAPHMHAMMLDLMAPRLGAGSGTGSIVACMAKMGAKAYGIKHLAPLVERSVAAVSKMLGPGEFEIVTETGGWAGLTMHPSTSSTSAQAPSPRSSKC